MFLHVNHSTETVLHLLQILLVSIWVQNIVEYSLLVLLKDSIATNVALVLNKVGHYLVLYGVAILLSTHTIENLLLQLSKLLAAIGILKSLVHKLLHLWIELHMQHVVDAKHPTHKCTLAYILIATLLINIHQRAELNHIKAVHSCQSCGAYDNLLID